MAYQNQVAHKGYLQQQKSLLRGRLPEFQCGDQPVVLGELLLQDRAERVGDSALARVDTSVRARGLALPSYAWSWTMSDVAGGDGDGLIEVGETIDLNLDVLNTGEGAGGLARFMLETDAPYLTPMPHRGKPNEPAFVRHTAEFAAGLFGVPPVELARISTENARSFLGL